MKRFISWTAASFALLLACGQSGPTTRHTLVSQDLSELRSQFNADTEKVRAIFLAAPT
jgi:hypothetical protein